MEILGKKAGVSRKFYSSIHEWLNHNYGKANKCENKDCVYPRRGARQWLEKPKHFEWAKKREKPYDYKKSHFLQLCISCHRKYDVTEEFRKKMRELNRFTYITHCKLGHPLFGKNLLIINLKNGKKTRTCIKCVRRRGREANARWYRNNKYKVSAQNKLRYCIKIGTLKQLEELKK